MNPLRWLTVSMTLATAEAPTVLSRRNQLKKKRKGDGQANNTNINNKSKLLM